MCCSQNSPEKRHINHHCAAHQHRGKSCCHSHNHHHHHHHHKSSEKLIPAKLNKSASMNRLNSKYIPSSTIVQQQHQSHRQSCSFARAASRGHSAGDGLIVQRLNIQLQKIKIELRESKKEKEYFEIECRKYKEKDRHLQVQMQYLRSQLDNLVNSHKIDVKEEIKKHLSQNTQLNLTINKLISQLADRQREIQNLRIALFDERQKKNKHLKDSQYSSHELQKLAFKYNHLFDTYKKLESQSAKDKNQLTMLKKKYELLTESLNSQQKNKTSKLNKQNQNLQKIEKRLKSSQTSQLRIKQLFNIEKADLQSQIQKLKASLLKKQETISKLKIKCNQLQIKNNQLRDDLQHSKKIIFKYQEIKKRKQHQYIQHPLNDQSQIVQNKFLQKQELQRLKEANKKLSQEIQQLKKLIEQLKKPARKDVQGSYTSNHHTSIHQTIINQDLFLTIGASEQFQRIVKEKNQIIKRLMRQKNDLYEQIYQKSAYK